MTVPTVPVDISSILDIPSNGSIIFQEIGFTTDCSGKKILVEDISTVIQIYEDEMDPSLYCILQDISLNAAKIKNTDFQGNGTIEDYAELFTEALKLMRNNTFVIDISGFYDFGNAADELSNVFQDYIFKLQSIKPINNLDFLKAISISLEKISNLAHVFGTFKQTILSTSIIQIPKSLQYTRYILQDVISEVNSAMTYINHFIIPDQDISMADLSIQDKELIHCATHSINHCNNTHTKKKNDILSENVDIQFIEEANKIIAETANILKNSTTIFKGKISTI
jgi:hypothetical protein